MQRTLPVVMRVGVVLLLRPLVRGPLSRALRTGGTLAGVTSVLA